MNVAVQTGKASRLVGEDIQTVYGCKNIGRRRKFRLFGGAKNLLRRFELFAATFYIGGRRIGITRRGRRSRFKMTTSNQRKIQQEEKEMEKSLDCVLST